MPRPERRSDRLGWAAAWMFGLLGVLQGCALRQADQATEWRLPAEWEPHEAVWVTFMGQQSDLIVFDIIEAIAPRVPLKIVVPVADAEGNALSGLDYAVRMRLAEMGIDPKRVSYVRSPAPVQVRDTGPLFVSAGDGARAVVDFAWNAYGAHAGDPSYLDPINFDSVSAAAMGLPTLRSRLVMEGGALETNGEGVLLQVESVTLQRNPGWSKADIEAELGKLMGVQQVLWLKDGPADDPPGLRIITDNFLGTGVGGHVDEVARFVGPRTILLGIPDSAEAAGDPVKRITLERMNVNLQRLESATDPKGLAFEVVRVPVPDVPYTPLVADPRRIDPNILATLAAESNVQQGDTLFWVPAASYLNYFVTNGIVLVPAYWRQGLPDHVRREDETVRALLKEFYPDREIVGMDAALLNDHAGGIHCWTLQEPVVR